MKNRKSSLLDFWPLFFLLASLEAAVALYFTVRVPSEGGNISVLRWVLMAPLFLGTFLLTLAAIFTWKNPNLRNRWLDPTSHPQLYNYLVVGFSLLSAITGIGAFTLRWWNPDLLLPFFVRTWPLMAYTIIFSIQFTLWLLVLRFGLHKADFPALRPALFAFSILLLILILVSTTKLGLTPDPAYWGEPGIPIQAWQLGLALTVSVLVSAFSWFHHERELSISRSRKTDLIIGFLIWALAAGIWLSVPNDVLKNSFYFPIDPPANIPLPHSDSAYYDHMAHSLLVGTDYTGEIPTRPLYIVFLAALHLTFAGSYPWIIFGQTLVLALIPVVFFALGRNLHSRLAGVTVALLAIFREWTSLLVSSNTRVSNTKMLLVDNPTLLLILLACFFAFRWLQRKDRLSAFIAGGVFGILLLLRTQAMLILPLVLLVGFLVLRSKNRPWLIPVLLFGVGVIVSITPWLSHNYLRIGKFTFDAPFQLQVLASQYAYTGNLDFNAVDLESKSLSQILITFALKDPGFVAGFITNHFLATEIGALLTLPLMAPFDGLKEPINLYWTTFDGSLTWINTLLLMIYLAIIAIGLGSSWKRWRWTGLLPLAFNLGYAMANGIGRFSGWRYNLPADWIAYFYFGFGAAEIIFWCARVFGSKIQPISSEEYTAPKRRPVIQIIPYTLLFALIGALPWIAEGINPPPRFSDQGSIPLHAQIAPTEKGITPEIIQLFSSQPEAVTLAGRALYPRTFASNSGLTSTNSWPAYALRDYPRLGFRLLNRDLTDIVFPNKGVPVDNIQGYDSIVLGCDRGSFIEARLLVFPKANLSYLSNLGLGPCSP